MHIYTSVHLSIHIFHKCTSIYSYIHIWLAYAFAVEEVPEKLPRKKRQASSELKVGARPEPSMPTAEPKKGKGLANKRYIRTPIYVYIYTYMHMCIHIYIYIDR